MLDKSQKPSIVNIKAYLKQLGLQTGPMMSFVTDADHLVISSPQHHKESGKTTILDHGFKM
jgi:hypothetical protein